MGSPCDACGQPLKPGARRWHEGCVPQSFYRANLHRANRLAVSRRRRKKFAAELDRLISERGTLTREDLLDFAADVHGQGWALGYGASEAKWRKRTAQKAA